jgi:hypothetical protein
MIYAYASSHASWRAHAHDAWRGCVRQENFRGETYDEKVDQFSFAMIMYGL